MIHTRVYLPILALSGLLLLPGTAAALSWADTVGTGANFTNTNTVNQTPGSTLTSQSVGVPGSVKGYQPLEPLKSTFDGSTYKDFADYLNTVYKLAITIGALIAVVMLVTGGVRYMLSESFTDKDKARSRIKNALWGLTILIGSFLILYTINPNLLTFNLTLPNVNQQAAQFTGATGGTNTAQNLGNPTNATITNWDGFSSLSLSQGYGVNQALGCSFYNIACLGSQKYITYYPDQANTSEVQQAIRSYNSGCSGVSNVFLGNVKTLDGSLVGSPGQTLLVCAGPFQ